MSMPFSSSTESVSGGGCGAGGSGWLMIKLIVQPEKLQPAKERGKDSSVGGPRSCCMLCLRYFPGVSCGALSIDETWSSCSAVTLSYFLSLSRERCPVRCCTKAYETPELKRAVAPKARRLWFV